MKRKTFAKVLDIDKKLTDKLIDITKGAKQYIEVNGKHYYFNYAKGWYVEEIPYPYNLDDDDVPF